MTIEEAFQTMVEHHAQALVEIYKRFDGLQWYLEANRKATEALTDAIRELTEQLDRP